MSRETTKEGLFARFLRGLNLRPEESNRTFWMFLGCSTMSVGVLWLETAATGIFVAEYGTDRLPLIYLSSTLVSIFLGVIYAWVQSIVPLRWSLVLVSLLMAFPVLLFYQGLVLPPDTPVLWMGGIVGLTTLKMVAIAMRLWLQVVYVLNDLNTSITANQLFNVRELRRTYPLISSGVLVADAASGFLLSGVLAIIGSSGVVLVSFSMMILATGILFLITQKQSRFFDTTSRRREVNTEATQQLRGQTMNYRWLLLLFFVLAEAMFWLLDFQFNKELEGIFTRDLDGIRSLPFFLSQGQGVSEKIAGFLGFFQGTLGVCELMMQWFVARWVIDRFGVFTTTGILPTLILTLGGSIAVANLMPSIAQMGLLIFWAVVALKFLYELFHFTLLASVGPVLFQPIPQKWRNAIQASVRGNAEPFANALIGLFILGLMWVFKDQMPVESWRNLVFPMLMAMAVVWLMAIYFVRRNYEAILVMGARQELLSGRSASPAAIKELKRAAVSALSQPGMEDSQMGCVELLIKIDASNALDVLAPMLQSLPQEAQVRVLEIMQENPQPQYAVSVGRLITYSKPAPVVAAALRYVYGNDRKADLQQLTDYLRPQAPASVRATAAALLLEHGDRDQRAQVTNFLRLMLTSPNPEERRASCDAIRHLKYLQALQLYILEIVKEERSIEVRCAVLEVVAATHFEKCYPALVAGLHDPQTRSAAIHALTSLDNEALPLLKALVKNWREQDSVRNIAWGIIGQVGTPEAIAFLIEQLPLTWSADRTSILRALIKVPIDQGIDRTADQLGRSGIESLVDQDLMLISHTTAAMLDLAGRVQTRDLEEMLYRALQGVQSDCIDRIFLLMQFLYEPEIIQAAEFSFKSGFSDDMAQGLEILDTKLDIPQKRSLLIILEISNATKHQNSHASISKIPKIPKAHKTKNLAHPTRSTNRRFNRQSKLDLERQLQSLSSLVTYTSLDPVDRLRELMDLRHFLSDWVLACCFHLARAEGWQLERHQVLDGLRGGSSLLREASLLYLHNLSQRGTNNAAFLNVLPRMQNDSDAILRRQVQVWMEDYGLSTELQMKPLRPSPQDDVSDIPSTEIFGYVPKA